MQFPATEQWDRASSSKYSCPAARSLPSSHCGGAKYELPPLLQQQQQQLRHQEQQAQQLQTARPGPMDTIDDFITHESGNSLLLCVFSILLVFPGSACLLVIGAAFTLDRRLRERHQWVGPCAIAMMVLGVVLLVTACVIFASICRSYRRARVRRRLEAAAAVEVTPAVVGSIGGSPYTCIVQV